MNMSTQWKKSAGAVDRILMISLVLVIVTGILMHPLKDFLIMTVLHAVSGLVFGILCVVHILQHKKKR